MVGTLARTAKKYLFRLVLSGSGQTDDPTGDPMATPEGK
jgi:hypothetical protein